MAAKTKNSKSNADVFLSSFDDYYKRVEFKFLGLREKFAKEAAINPSSAVEWAGSVVEAQAEYRALGHAKNAIERAVSEGTLPYTVQSLVDEFERVVWLGAGSGRSTSNYHNGVHQDTLVGTKAACEFLKNRLSLLS